MARAALGRADAGDERRRSTTSTRCASQRLPANLIQAQRDYFGAHTYQRTTGKASSTRLWHGDEQPVEPVPLQAVTDAIADRCRCECHHLNPKSRP